jgi:AcrR family transcriptional regulator
MSTTDSAPPAGGKRERTRAALIEATLQVVEEKGFAAASLDEIAARAGMTKGAIYSNFAGKAGLLMAAMAARGLTLSSHRAPAATIDEELRAAGAELAATLARAAGEGALVGQFQLYAAGDADFRAGLADAYREALASTANYLAGLDGDCGGFTAPELAAALQAVAMGFLVQAFITPDLATPALARKTLAALADGLAARRR